MFEELESMAKIQRKVTEPIRLCCKNAELLNHPQASYVHLRADICSVPALVPRVLQGAAARPEHHHADGHVGQMAVATCSNLECWDCLVQEHTAIVH